MEQFATEAEVMRAAADRTDDTNADVNREIDRIQGWAPAGRKCTSTSKPMWKLSWTPTAEPRKMNQLISRIATGSTHKRLSFTT